MNFISQVVTDEYVWKLLAPRLLARNHRTKGRWININCPMCVFQGTTADRKYRCGVIREHGSIGVTCFNCKFKTGFTAGRHLSQALADFLSKLGVPDREIQMLRYQLHQIAAFTEVVPESAIQPALQSFDPIALPSRAKLLRDWEAEDCTDRDYVDVVSYLLSRGDDIVTATDYYWSPCKDHAINRSLIVPCMHNGKVVGWIARAIDSGRTKYYSQAPKNFLFNLDSVQQSHRKYVFVVEGVFDALAIDAIGALGGSLNTAQIRWLSATNKQVIVVPDRDKAGKALLDVAIAEGWAVSTPRFGGRHWWDADIKDAADAVRRYGRLYTLSSIIHSATDDKVQIKIRSAYF